MERYRQRNAAEMQTLTSELQALKRKLHSKTEALLIISKDLDSTQRERDQYKLMAEKLRIRCQAYKRQFSDYPLSRDQASLIQMLRDMKNQKLAHQRQNESLQQKLNEALGDVKLLRERFARQRIGDEGVGPRYFLAHEREELVEQLENAKQLAEQYMQECNCVSDEISELRLENKEFKMRSERLNNELNFMLNGDKKRIIDIDALCMENKYLQERVKQCQEEKNSLHAQLNKMKTALNARKATQSEIMPGRLRSSGLVISPKQIKEILINGAGLPSSAETVADLQSIAAALLETINDKNLALHHLRNTNKILGNRVAELERKLRTLEVAGLWNMAGIPHRSGHSTPKIKVETPKKVVGDDHPPTTETDEEFMSSLGSRLSRLTDVCAKSFREYKLVSLTPESSGDTSSRGSATNLTGDVTPNEGSAANLAGDVASQNGSATNREGNVTLNEGSTTKIDGNVTSVHESVSDVDGIGTIGDVASCEDGAIKTAGDATDTESVATKIADNVMFGIGSATNWAGDATSDRGDGTTVEHDGIALVSDCAADPAENATSLQNAASSPTTIPAGGAGATNIDEAISLHSTSATDVTCDATVSEPDTTVGCGVTPGQRGMSSENKAMADATATEHGSRKIPVDQEKDCDAVKTDENCEGDVVKADDVGENGWEGDDVIKENDGEGDDVIMQNFDVDTCNGTQDYHTPGGNIVSESDCHVTRSDDVMAVKGTVATVAVCIQGKNNNDTGAQSEGAASENVDQKCQ